MDTAWRPNGFLIKKLKMKKYYQHSYATFWLGLIVGVLVGFLNFTIATIIIGAALIQLFIFYRCPYCNYGLYDVRGGMPNCCPNCGKDLD